VRVIIFGANGLLGQYSWKAAIAAGHEVCAFVRSPTKLDSADPRYEKLKVVQGDVMDAAQVRTLAEGYEVAISCVSPAGGNTAMDMATSIVTNAKAAGVGKFYMVGGLGALWKPSSGKTVLVQDAEELFGPDGGFGLPALPMEKVKGMTTGHLAVMEFMQSTGVQHTFICPGVMADAAATDNRLVALDELVPGAFKVTLGDVAQTIVDDLPKGELIGHRVCVVTPSMAPVTEAPKDA
jgi:putative NADH-flavin reductase